MLDSAFSSVFGTADSLVSSVSTVDFLICCVASILLGAAVAGVYMFRHTYSKNFVVTLALLPLIVQMVITLVNGMGGTPGSELYICHRRLAQLLEADGVVIERALVGDYVTSLEMPGVSVTLTRVDDELLGLFDAPARTPAWK